MLSCLDANGAFGSMMGRFFKLFTALLGALVLSSSAQAQDATVRVSLQTSMGQIVLELDRQRAPFTVANFLRYVMEGHFNNTVFYRVVPRFVVQGGLLAADGTGR